MATTKSGTPIQTLSVILIPIKTRAKNFFFFANNNTYIYTQNSYVKIKQTIETTQLNSFNYKKTLNKSKDPRINSSFETFGIYFWHLLF